MIQNLFGKISYTTPDYKNISLGKPEKSEPTFFVQQNKPHCSVHQCYIKNLSQIKYIPGDTKFSNVKPEVISPEGWEA